MPPDLVKLIDNQFKWYERMYALKYKFSLACD